MAIAGVSVRTGSDAAAGVRQATGERPLPGAGERAKLSRRAVAGLDAARALAAFYVVLHHIADAHHWADIHHWPRLGFLLRFGQEAVIVFFLLSGFVIFINEADRALRPTGYYVRRLRRIYPPLIVAMALSTAIAIDNGDLAEKFSTLGLIGTIASVQDISLLKPGVIADPYLDNGPLWSLSYEVAFYALFPLALMAWRRSPAGFNHLLGIACCLAYLVYALAPNHWALVAAYFLVWWCGAMTAEAYRRGGRSFSAICPLYCWLVALCGLAAAIVPIVGYRGLGLYPFLPLRHFLAAAVILALCLGPLGRRAASFAERCAWPAAALASISYGIYVFHYPLLINWQRAVSAPGAMIAFLLLLVLSYVADRQLNRLLPQAKWR